MFEAFNASFAQQPLLLWVAAAVGLALVAARRGTSRSVTLFCLLFGLVPFVDAWLTADRIAGIGTLSPALATAVATFFVIVGDLRVFLFLASATRNGRIVVTGPSALRALMLSLVVPIAASVFHTFYPEGPTRARATFLFYEALLSCFLLALRTSPRARALLPAAGFGWGRTVIAFVLAYYTLWAAGDALVLFLHLDFGYLLRVVANVLYYGGLLVAVSYSAPRATARSARAQEDAKTRSSD